MFSVSVTRMAMTTMMTIIIENEWMLLLDVKKYEQKMILSLCTFLVTKVITTASNDTDVVTNG
jgi:hypothetical protein